MHFSGRVCIVHMRLISASVLILVLLLAGCSQSPEQQEATFMKTGKQLFEKKDYPRAALQYMNAAKVAPTDAEPVYQLALTYIQMQDYRNALASFRKALDINPKHAGA